MTEHSVRRQLPRFAIIGGIGFVIDAAILTALVTGIGMGPISARGISFAIAATATWSLNRNWTFRVAGALPRGPEYARYITVQVVGAVINLSVYLASISVYPQLGLTPVLPLAIGAGIAMIFNFLASRFWVFTPAENPHD